MFELLRQRRSVRSYQNKPISAEQKTLLGEALLRSPSSRNLQPCEFILIDDLRLLQQIAQAKPHGASFLASAPLAIAIVADPRVSDVWIEDSSIAAIVAQLAAEQLGLKSCWAQFRLRAHNDDLSASAYVRDLLGVPEELEVPVVLSVGYGNEDKEGHPENRLMRSKIYSNRYKN